MCNGPIPDGMVVRHRCDNPPCFRLSHLELGTVADNNNDAAARGHAGRPAALRPSELERLAAERATGRPYSQIYADWPEIRPRITLRGLADVGKKLERGWTPAGPPERPVGYIPQPKAKPPRKPNPAAAKYAAWRNKQGDHDDDGTGPAVRP